MRYREFRIVESKLFEAEARIQHAEDIIFWEGSKGAVRVIDSLKKLEQGAHRDTTLKWDGSPAIIFGRNEDGEFILTDKGGFGAKGYDGKAKSPNHIEKMLMGRPGARNPDEKKRNDYLKFVGNMKDIFDEYEKATPKDFRGYLKGDLLYYNTPPTEDGKFVFTPNIVTYKVDQNSELGKNIARSKTGVVVHRLMDESGAEGPVPAGFELLGTEVLLFPSVTVQRPAEVDDEDINTLKAEVAQNATAIDALLNKPKLEQMKMKGFPNMLYTYINSKVDTGLTNLGDDFTAWVGTAKLSEPMKKKVIEWVQQNNKGFAALWRIVTDIQKVKDKIIKQFDSHDADVQSSTAGQPGGEGYVMTHPQGDIKLVSRAGFTAANRSVER